MSLDSTLSRESRVSPKSNLVNVFTSAGTAMPEVQ
jgi:hypothetical protein